jgi:3-oxoacyl-[acyl-carrier protein] reductase
MARLKDKTAFITGSSRGIGAGIAKLFAREGAKVALHGRDTQALSAVVAEIVQAGGETTYVTGDVTKFSDIEAMRWRIEREFGPVDILVANAGGSFTTPGPIEQMSEEEWRASIDGNLTATFFTFLGFSYGFRPKRSQHDALDALITGIHCTKVNYIFDRTSEASSILSASHG